MLIRAPAKLNLCLYVGEARSDGLHAITSIFVPLALADEITVEPSRSGLDEVICAGVEGSNLANLALGRMRAEGWDAEPVRLTIDKRIPVAAGLGGGSADAAAALRLWGSAAGLERLAADLGADVPSQLDPRPLLVGGAGEVLEPIGPAAAAGVVMVALAPGLTAGEVYAAADRLGQPRSGSELGELRRRLGEIVSGRWHAAELSDLLVNDLEPAAIELHPGIRPALEALRGAGATTAMVSGSGPTGFGIFPDREAAERAARSLDPEAGRIIATSIDDRPAGLLT